LIITSEIHPNNLYHSSVDKNQMDGLLTVVEMSNTSYF
jgi:hypothetical protein